MSKTNKQHFHPKNILFFYELSFSFMSWKFWCILVSSKRKGGRDMDTKKIGAFLKQCRKEKNLPLTAYQYIPKLPRHKTRIR